MHILLVNDDGYQAPGIVKLAEALASIHRITVVAPDRCYSGNSHAMNFRKPVYVHPIEGRVYRCYAVEGTPGDCVKLGLKLLENDRPDLVVSGINNEPNLGTDAIYSGTVNAAVEGTINGIDAIALSGSAKSEADFDYIVDFAIKHLDFYIRLAKKSGTAVNVNINNASRGNRSHRLVPLGDRKYTDLYHIEQDKKGVSYTLNGEAIYPDHDDGSDIFAYRSGYATVTPILSDWTHFGAIGLLSSEFSDGNA